VASDEFIFSVRNKHSVAAGEPPKVDANTKGKYHSYFENGYGEQAIFIYDRETQSGLLWHGDAGWEKPYKVIDGLAPELVLSEEEEMWLQACWNAATASEGK
jgi:hypothetical protein